MKLSCSLAVVVSLSGASAWVVPASQTTSTRQRSALNAQKPAWMSAATAAVAGWVLSTQIVSATITPSVDASPTVDNYPSTMIAIGAYVPEDSYTSTDMSMPKYNTAGTAEMLAAPGSKLAGAGGEAKTVKVTVKKGEDPEKALARAQQEAEKREAKAKKLAETEAKMAAKKAERAKIQGKRES